MTTTDRTTEPADVFDAHLARWEAAEADPDGTVERVARALAEHEPRYRSGYLTGEPDWIECGQADAEVATCSWRSDPEADAQDTAAAHHRHVAAAAIAALRPAPDAPRVDEGAVERVRALAAPGDPDARMDAYYYGFEPTGIGIIDAILSAVATAGKHYHGTDMWTDEDYGPSEEACIQAAADKAALELRAALDAAS
jgi:hypothetical protein